jgi:hypothetical protein
MALSDKNIVITPNIGAASDPKIVFSGADASTTAQNITLTTYPTSNGTLSFDGSAGQLFSITNSLSGTIFSVNDVSGIPSIEVLDTGVIKLAQYSGSVGIGTSSPAYKLDISGTLRATGAITLNSGNNSTAIINGGTSGIGNIGASGQGFNTIFAKATSAQYADLAENYSTDANYEPGTVVMFGGDCEITLATEDSTARVAGVVSTNPAYLMNDELKGDNIIALALTGRVPTKVQGTVRKGDLMVSAGNGCARAEDNPRVGTIIGKALENFNGHYGVIEVVIGKH